MTSSPEFNRALCTEIGPAGAPFTVVNATQYAMAGQSNLFTFVKFPSSHCWEIELGISSPELLSSSVFSLILPLFFLLACYGAKEKCYVVDTCNIRKIKCVELLH